MVLTNSHLVSSALHWDVDYLGDNLGDGLLSVYVSDSHIFKYFDAKKLARHPNFKTESRNIDIPYSEFIKKVQNAKPNGERYVGLTSFRNCQPRLVCIVKPY